MSSSTLCRQLAFIFSPLEEHCFTNLDLSRDWMRKCTAWHWLWNIWQDTRLRASINNSFQVTGQNRIPTDFKAINWLLDSIKSLWMWKVWLKFKNTEIAKAALFYFFPQLVWHLCQWEKSLGGRGLKIETTSTFFGLYTQEPSKDGKFLKPLPFLPNETKSLSWKLSFPMAAL